MFTVIKFVFFLFYPVNVFLKMYVTFCTNLYVEMYKYWQFTDLVKKTANKTCNYFWWYIVWMLLTGYVVVCPCPQL